MNIETFFYSLFIAAAYVSWPNMAKPLGVKPGVSITIILAVGLIVTTVMNRHEISELPKASRQALVIMLGIAIANGIATSLYTRLTADHRIPTGIFIVTTTLLMTGLAPIADWLLNKNKPSPSQCLGFAMIAPVVWLLSRR